ncbi:Mucin-associated surface protein (MASP) [Trypanosoma cruzi]|uniref:Mucin-associated surface protein (MASP) n=1 Tax=Trypanosoma cruzi TaxID=5693 RepID=A0A2V2WWH1_TRYCR|nr:Mucin-associated surface protein (MASP) [Trypanosoma cruzi]
MAMMMTGRVLLVCALCVLWCVAGGVYARDVDTNALGGCMASGVLGENGSHMPDGCNKTAITVPLRSALPITAVEASTGKADDLATPNNSNSSETSNAGSSPGGGPGGVTGSSSAGGTSGPAAVPGASGAGEGGAGVSGDGSTGDQGTGGPPAPAAAPPSPASPSGGPSVPAAAPGGDSSASGSDGEAGPSGTNSSNTTGDSPTGDQTPAAAAAHNSSPPEGPTGTTSGTGHKGQEKKRKKKRKKKMKSSSKVMRHKPNNINSMNTPRKMAKNPRKTKLLFVQMPPQIQATVTAAPRSPTPPPLFCLFFLLLVLLRLRWWPRESEGERAMHRPHTHSSFSLCVSVSPCMDSRPHLTPRGTHNVPIVYMHAHPCRPVGALFCTTRTAAVLSGCMGGAP